jgi:hypothetical protein
VKVSALKSFILFQGEDGVDYEFGIKPSGLLVKKRGNIIGNYVWLVLSFKEILHVLNGGHQSPVLPKDKTSAKQIFLPLHS